MFANEVTYRSIALAMLLLMMAIRRRTRRRGDNSGDQEAFKVNSFDTRLLSSFGVLWIVSVAIYALAPKWTWWVQLDFATWVRLIGVATGCGSLALLAWSDHHLGVNFSPTLTDN